MTILPYDHQAEADTIGCIIRSPANLIVAAKQLNAADFHHSTLSRIYTTISEMFEDGVPVDETTVASRLAAADRPALRDAVEGSKESNNFDTYLTILHDRRARREVLNCFEDVVHSIRNDDEAVEGLRLLEQTAFRLRSKHAGKTNDTRHPISEMAEWWNEYLSDEWIDDDEFPFSHAMPTLQKSMGSFGIGELGIIAGYSSDGKSVYGLQHAAHIAQERPGTKIGYYSLEMPEKQVWRRLASHTGIPLKVIKNRTWTPEQAEVLRERAKLMQDWNFDVHSGTVNMDQIRADQMKYQYDIIYIDHLHRMPGSSDRIKLEEIARSCKSLALDGSCAVVALSQLSRREGFPPPSTNQLRGTDVLTQEADWVLFAYRERGEDGLRTLQSRIIVGKVRDGETDIEVECVFNPNAMRFEERGMFEMPRADRDTIAIGMT